MSDDRIGESLRALPREAAAPEFTAAVLARVAAEPDRGRRTGAAGGPSSGRLLWAGAALAAAGVAVVAGLFVAGGSGGGRPGAIGETARDEGVAVPPATEIQSAAVAPSPPGEPLSRAAGRSPLATAPGGGVPRPSRPRLAAAPPAPDRDSVGPSPLHGPDPAPATALAVARPGEPPGLFQARAELADLRRRHRRFASELRTFEDFAGDGGPVLYLGGDEALEVVLKLGPAEPGTAPASTRSGGAGPRPAVERRPPPSQPYY